MLLIAMLRNHLVYKYQIKAIRETNKKARNAANNDGDWEKYYTKLDNYDTYDKMFPDIRKWTYKQFYPDL